VHYRSVVYTEHTYKNLSFIAETEADTDKQ